MNWAELRANHEEIGNHHTQNEFGAWGDDKYQANWGIRQMMYGTQARRLIPQVI